MHHLLHSCWLLLAKQCERIAAETKPKRTLLVFGLRCSVKERRILRGDDSALRACQVHSHQRLLEPVQIYLVLTVVVSDAPVLDRPEVVRQRRVVSGYMRLQSTAEKDSVVLVQVYTPCARM